MHRLDSRVLSLFETIEAGGPLFVRLIGDA